MRSAVIVPTYNEHDNIDTLMAELLALPIDLNVVVVDDDSPDGTGGQVDAWVASDNRVHAIHRAGKL